MSEKSKKPYEKILIVDDDEDIRKGLTQFFEGKGLQVFSAQSGEEALYIVKKYQPSVILLDLTLPGMDGILALKKIQEMAPGVGVIIVTGTNDEEIAKEAAKVGSYHYVVKPIDMEYLELVVMTRLAAS